MNNGRKNNSIEEAFNAALSNHQAGRLSQAKSIYEKIIHAEPNHSDALHLFGLIAHQTGNNGVAVEFISKAIRVNASCPSYFYNLGEAYRAMHRYDEALVSFRKALSLSHDFVDAHVGIGNVFMVQGKHDLALGDYRKALSLKPDYAEVHNNIGNAFMEQGLLDQALASYRKALSLKPDYAEAHNNLGNGYRKQGDQEQALASYRQALTLNPGLAETHVSLGLLYREQGDQEQALASYRRALKLNPDLAEAHFNLGILYKEQGMDSRALASYRKALTLNPDFAEAHVSLGILYLEQGRQEQALASYHKALSLKPDYAEARVALAMAQIPVIYRLGDDPRMYRTEFTRELSELSAWFEVNGTDQAYQSVGYQQPFYLAYQEYNNRKLLSRYGALCSRLMERWNDKQEFPCSGIASTDVVRVGIVSAQIRSHSVWDAIVKGWIRNIDRNRFELHVFHIGYRQDEETTWARSHSTFFEQSGKGLQQWVEAIVGGELDVLIYPEIGMDPMTVKLASLRLAPVQMAAWGHPETTGLPTMDYYLSAEDFEPRNAQENYTEQLVPLPHLGCCYHPLPVTISEPDFDSLGIDREHPILLCPGTPFKYMPRYDRVLAKIAHRVGKCTFVFFIHHFPGLSEILRKRIESVFAQKDLNIDDYVVFIPWQERSAFYGLMKHADVFLDTMGFSGFNTAMQAVECGLPVVANDGCFMRGRLASGILRRMGLPELIAESEENYISLVTRLAQDSGYRGYIRQSIAEKRQILFDDPAPVRALEELLMRVTEKHL